MSAKSSHSDDKSHAEPTATTNHYVRAALAIIAAACVVICGLIWGMSAAIALVVGYVLTAFYVAVNDVRLSVIKDNSSWRRRHRVLSFVVPKHPLDNNEHEHDSREE